MHRYVDWFIHLCMYICVKTWKIWTYTYNIYVYMQIGVYMDMFLYIYIYIYLFYVYICIFMVLPDWRSVQKYVAACTFPVAIIGRSFVCIVYPCSAPKRSILFLALVVGMMCHIGCTFFDYVWWEFGRQGHSLHQTRPRICRFVLSLLRLSFIHMWQRFFNVPSFRDRTPVFKRQLRGSDESIVVPGF